MECRYASTRDFILEAVTVVEMNVYPWTCELFEKVPPLMDTMRFFRTDTSTLPKSNEDLLPEMDHQGAMKPVPLGHGNETI